MEMAPALMLRCTRLLFAIALGACCGRDVARAETSSPAVTIKLSEWGAAIWSTPYRRTVAFISDSSIAVLLCGQQNLTGCRLIVADFSNGKIKVRTETTISGSASEVRRVDGQGIMVSFDFKVGHRLYSPDLTILQDLPNPWRISISGNVIASRTKEGQVEIYRIDGSRPLKISVVESGGELEAVSEDYVVLREGNTIHTKTIKGPSMGAFKVKSPTKCATEVELAGAGRLYLQSCLHDSMVDYEGNTITHLRAPNGWGWRRGWNEDGRRLIYDYYKRRVSFLRNARETAVAVATLGVGAVDEIANGETVRVVDTATGNICFEWNSPRLPEIAIGYHADVSPSGKYAAVITDDSLSIYALPESCGKK
jgi:hypothetical protein